MENSFKELEQIHLLDFEEKSPEVKHKIESETTSFKFIGDVIDLYFSKLMGVFVGMTGGDPNDEQTSKLEK